MSVPAAAVCSAPSAPVPCASQPRRVAGAQRVLVLDLLRLLAAFQMVQGHTIDALLADSHRGGPGHGLWLHTRGLTSVAFLLVAGLAFGASALRLVGLARSRETASRGLLRAGLLIALGYGLHLPLGLLSHPAAAEAERLLRAASAVDILQCTGVSLAVLEMLAFVLPSRRAVQLACGALSVLLIAAAPGLAPLVPSGPLLPLMDYLSPAGGSLFPLFPWAGHLFAGVALSSLVLAPRARGARFAAAAVVALGGGAVLHAAGGGVAADHVSRLGWVFAVGATLCPLERWVETWPGWVLRLPRETLFIYLFHILLVYGDPFGLHTLVGRVLTPLAAVASAVCIVGLSFGAAACRRAVQRSAHACYAATRAALAGSTATG